MKATRTLYPAGFTLAEILVVMAIIGLLTAIAIPNFMSARGSVQSKTCINNLGQIDEVTARFALENNKTAGSPINFSDTLTPYVRLDLAGGIPGCPAGGIYSVNAAGDLPTCLLGSLATAPHILQ